MYTPTLSPLLKFCRKGAHYLPRGQFRRNGDGRLRSNCKMCEKGTRPSGKRHLARIPRQAIEQLLARQGWKCACGCGRSIRYDYHVDHIKPLAKGGEHAFHNWQLLAPICNLKKGAKYS